ncbi:MAG: hypothetical protein PHH85_02370 [Candidatus Methanoperedens sp.]|nr:hypothetical protein [Candidatus Methanoperedens sp.]
MNKEEIQKIIDEKGMDWLIAAMVDGSIGYHSPNSARMLIQRILEGETHSWCERCLACYKGDLLSMVDSDVRVFRYLETIDSQKVERLTKFVQAAGNLTPLQEMGLSAMYPTMGV